jgi:hypothetical protein
MSHPHLDVLFEDEFSRFVADGLSPTLVVNVSPERINLGLRAADGSVDVFLGGLSVSEAQSLRDSIDEAIDVIENEGGSTTITAIEPEISDDD